jgi:hypothetical protein
MDKSNGQAGRTAASAPTREKLMAAAAELIAELGWGRVTTRAVAERAGLPHGALTEAAVFAFAQTIPKDEFAALAVTVRPARPVSGACRGWCRGGWVHTLIGVPGSLVGDVMSVSTGGPVRYATA